ncbi:MAG: ABC transporter substrate-binding protein [Tissierellia bacterium]|nr:ABC transporter substrate-binding protein [Tissierellia bacterium]
MKKFLIVIFLSLFLLSCSKEDVTNKIFVYNWGEYMDPSTIRQFEKETGIKVIYDTYASNEDLYMRMTSSSDRYDVVVPSDYMIERMIKEDLLQPFQPEKISNLSKINKNLKNPIFDKKNKFSIPYFWGTLGIIYNKSMIQEEITSWADLWNPKYKNQIIMYDSQRDDIAIALKKLGYSMNTKNEKELKEAEEALVEQKPLVYAYLADEARDVITQEDAAICVMYSGDALLMIEENPNLEYVVPKEGSNLWYDSFVIPKNANNPDGAHKFIDFMCRPDIAAINAEYCVGYSTPIPEAIDLLPKEIRDSKVAYPDIEELPPLEVYRDAGYLVDIYDIIWTRVRAEK